MNGFRLDFRLMRVISDTLKGAPLDFDILILGAPGLKMHDLSYI